MEKIDARSLILGISLSLAAAGFYDAVSYFLEGKTIETNIASFASLVTFAVTGIFFWAFFVRGKNQNGFGLTQKALAKNREEKENNGLGWLEETEQEKLRREFHGRVIAKTNTDKEDVWVSLSIRELKNGK
jgi:hypothetical protein